MINLFIFLLTVYGISNIFVYSSGPFHLFEKIREYGDMLPSNLGDMFHCMICFPTWVGIILSLINVFLFPSILFTPFYTLLHNIDLWWLIILLDGAIASGGNWLIHTLQEHLEKNDE